MGDYCGICDECNRIFYANDIVLSINGKYSSTKLNLEYCDNNCLEKQKKNFDFLNNSIFSEKQYTNSDILPITVNDYKEILNFFERNPNMIMKKKSIEIITEIENTDNKINKTTIDLEFLKDCKKMFRL